MSWTYAARISQAQECSEATSLVKVARHSPCLYGWLLEPNPNSPYENVRITSQPGRSNCECQGLVPPKSLRVQVGEQTLDSVDDLLRVWPTCGRCGHSLLSHGMLEMEPTEERKRRIQVGVRMDELLEVRLH